MKTEVNKDRTPCGAISILKFSEKYRTPSLFYNRKF